MTENNFENDYDYQVFKENMDSQAKHLQRWQAEQAKHYSDKVFNDLWNETLQEEGLDPQAYGNLAAQDPEHVKIELKKSMKNLVSNVKKGRNIRGQFAKQPQTPQGREVQQQDSRATLDALKEKANKGPLTSEDEIAALDALFGTTEPL